MKKRRGSVRCRCTTYMWHPGSLRDSSVSFENRLATSASRPAFAIQVTAKTTIALLRVLSSSSRLLFLTRRRFELVGEFIDQDGLFAVRPRRNHAHSRPGLLLDEC